MKIEIPSINCVVPYPQAMPMTPIDGSGWFHAEAIVIEDHDTYWLVYFKHTNEQGRVVNGPPTVVMKEVQNDSKGTD